MISVDCLKRFNDTLINSNIKINNIIDDKIIIKHPFYLDDIENEKYLINKFYDLKQVIKIDENINFKLNNFELITVRNLLVINFNINDQFQYFNNQIIRCYDEYRKVLTPIEYKKDIKRFGKLNKIQTYYYQIWGYPYLFEDNSFYIKLVNVLDLDNHTVSELKNAFLMELNKIKSFKIEKIALFKQDKDSENLKQLLYLDL